MQSTFICIIINTAQNIDILIIIVGKLVFDENTNIVANLHRLQ